MDGLHIFDLYRRFLMIVLAVYAVVRIIRATARSNWLGGRSRTQRMAKGYVATMLASVRIRRFSRDLLQIVGLLIALGCVLYGHRLVTP